MAIREAENMERIRGYHDHHHHHPHPVHEHVEEHVEHGCLEPLESEPSKSEKFVYVERPVIIEVEREAEQAVEQPAAQEQPMNDKHQYNSWLLTLLLMMGSGFGALAFLVLVTLGVVLATTLFGGGSAPTAIP